MAAKKRCGVILNLHCDKIITSYPSHMPVLENPFACEGLTRLHDRFLVRDAECPNAKQPFSVVRGQCVFVAAVCSHLTAVWDQATVHGRLHALSVRTWSMFKNCPNHG